MLKVLLVDDERGARSRLRRLLATVDLKMEIKESANGLDAVKKINDFEPDLVFLDIQMPGMSGFDVLYNIENKNFSVVFQTAYDQYAVKAFEENALDYILKPIGRDRFEKFWEKFKTHSQNSTKNTVDKLAAAGMTLNKISVKIGSKLKLIPVEKIYYFKSEDRLLRFYTEESNYSCQFTLEDLESKMNSDFIRIHRSSLVNTKFVESAVLEPNSTKLIMVNGEELEVARSKRQLVKSLFESK